jgi:hypothetical protein
MATFTTTAKYALRWLTGGNLVSDIDAGFQALAEDIDANMAGYASGTVGALPAAGKAGRIYRATDTGQVLIDTGSVWQEFPHLSALATWRTLVTATADMTSTSTVPHYFGINGTMTVNSSSPLAGHLVIPSPSGWAIGGLTPKLRITGGILCNDIACTTKINFKLRSIAPSGGSGLLSFSSTGASPSTDTGGVPNPSVTTSGATLFSSPESNVPATGNYALAAAPETALPAGVRLMITARVELHYVAP